MARMVCDFRAIREEMTGLTQKEIANLLGCSRAKVQRVECGEAYYCPEELVSLAQLTGSSVDALLGLESRMPHWLADYQRLGPEQQQLVDDVVDRLVAFSECGSLKN